MTTRPEYDVVIAGSGPAGSAAACALARAGWRVLIAEKRRTARARTAETVAPATKRLLSSYLAELEGGPALPHWAAVCPGNISVWGSAEAAQQSFDFSAYGKGLCVNRAGLDAALVAAAVRAGAELRTGCTVSGLGRDRDRWVLDLKTSDAGSAVSTVSAAYIVDATGRSAALGRALGLSQSRTDPLFSFAQLFTTDEEDRGDFTRIEACDYGWWYSNRLPSEPGARAQRLVVLHADRGSAAAKTAARPEGFRTLLSQTTLMQTTLSACGGQPTGKLHGAPAGNAALDHIAMQGFVAVGDAAQAYDPLSSQGLDRALTSGGLAGHALSYALSNPSDPRAYLAHYHNSLRQHWAQYHTQHSYYYAMETRWADHPFWARRQSAQTFPQPILARDAT